MIQHFKSITVTKPASVGAFGVYCCLASMDGGLAEFNCDLLHVFRRQAYPSQHLMEVRKSKVIVCNLDCCVNQLELCRV
jgi:hypothetical protein